MLIPYLGHLSDSCGHRWIFLIVSALLACALLAFVPFAAAAGSYLGDTDGSPKVATLALLCIAFPLADAACSITEQFVRVMVTDLAHGQKAVIMQGHGVLSAVAGLGSAMGYGIGAVDWSSVFGEIEPANGNTSSSNLTSHWDPFSSSDSTHASNMRLDKHDHMHMLAGSDAPSRSLPSWARPRASACVLALTGAALLAPGAALGAWLFVKWKA